MLINIGKQNDYVYDIETETLVFNCGFPLIIHNTYSFVLSVNAKDNMKGLTNKKDIFNFSNLDEIHELFSNKS